MKFHDLANGNVSKKHMLQIHIPLMILLYFGLLAISSITFPGFTITHYYISNMGNPYLNPDGWIIWSIAHGFYGIFMIPAVQYTHRTIRKQLKPIGSESSQASIRNDQCNQKLLALGRLLLTISAIGWLLMCFIPQYKGWGTAHAINAVLLLGGYYFGILTTTWLVNRVKIVSRKTTKLILFLWIFAPCAILLTQIIRIALGIPMNDSTNNESLWYINVSTWEWMMLFSIFTSFIVLIAGLKESTS
jgi:hypothetical protein